METRKTNEGNEMSQTKKVKISGFNHRNREVTLEFEVRDVGVNGTCYIQGNSHYKLNQTTGKLYRIGGRKGYTKLHDAYIVE